MREPDPCRARAPAGAHRQRRRRRPARRDAVATFLTEWALRGDRPRRLLPVRANGAPAFGQYVWDDGSGRLLAHGITVLTFQGEEIEEITAFLTPEAFARFGLPSELSYNAR